MFCPTFCCSNIYFPDLSAVLIYPDLCASSIQISHQSIRMANRCIVCAESVGVASISEYVQCEGPCKLFTHQKCSGVPKSALKFFNEFPNVHYYCEACNNTVKEFREGLADIQKSIDNLRDQVMNKTTNAAMLTASPRIVERPVQAGISSVKRRRVGEPSTPTWPLIQSSFKPPVSPRRNLFVGSLASEIVTSVEQRKSLVATMLHPSTKPDQLEAFLNKQLELPENQHHIRCSLMLPRGKDVSELDYVSFRVSAPESAYNRLCDAVNWPRGVIVREFKMMPRTDRRMGASLPVVTGISSAVPERLHTPEIPPV